MSLPAEDFPVGFVRHFVWLVSSLLFMGCTTTPHRQAIAPVPIPAEFKQAAAMRAELEPFAKKSAVAAAVTEPLVGKKLSEWWRLMSNPELDALIDRAIANNTDLSIATLRIVQAKVRADQAGADRWPTLSVPYQAKGEAPKGGIGSLNAGQQRETLHTYQISLRADWRPDLWGERSALVESAQMQLYRTTYQRDDTRRQMIANVAALYVEYLSLNDRVRVARETETVLRGMLESVSRRLEIGDATITDLEQQRAAVYAVQATIPALELQRETVSNAIAQLLGVTPVSLALSDRGLDSLTFAGLLPGIPASLVLRRPDVRVIEARMLSAHADIEVARARLLPPLDLTAQVGYGSHILSQLFSSHNLLWNAIANLSATIFDHGKRASEVEFSNALHEELTETYIKVIYNAIRETEDALATVQMTGKRIEAQAASVDAARRAWKLSMEAYEVGAVDYLTLIDTERTYHRTLDELYRIRMERMKGVVSLFAALGGGVTTPEEPGAAVPGLTADAAGAAPAGDIPYRKYALSKDEDERQRWFVELAGLHDRSGIPHVWRDLNMRYAESMAGRSLLPRLQGRVEARHTHWYRLYIAAFDTEEAAQEVCDQLTLKLQRCRIVSFGDIAPHYEVEEIQEQQTLVAMSDESKAEPQLSVGMLGDLMVPLVLQPVMEKSARKPGRIEVRPKGAVPAGDNFLPALVVPAVAGS